MFLNFALFDNECEPFQLLENQEIYSSYYIHKNGFFNYTLISLTLTGLVFIFYFLLYFFNNYYDKNKDKKEGIWAETRTTVLITLMTLFCCHGVLIILCSMYSIDTVNNCDVQEVS
eukprot:UN29220